MIRVFLSRPGVLKDPQIMSGLWLVIFYIVCLILARQVCVNKARYSLAPSKTNELMPRLIFYGVPLSG